MLSLNFCHPSSAQANDGSLDYAVIPAQTVNTPFSISTEQIDSLLIEVSTYFNFQLDASFCFKRTEIVSLRNDYSGSQASLAVAEACRLADEYVDFSLFDNNADGFVDCVCLIFSGDTFYPQEYSLSKDNIGLVLDGITIDRYILSSDKCNAQPITAGFMRHEFGHAAGLQDYYDTDGPASGGLAKALWGCTALMDRGDTCEVTPGLNAIDYHFLGRGRCDTLAVGQYVLKPVGPKNRYLYAPTDTPGEFFLFECRNAAGQDASIGGSGMLIYHIDRSTKDAGFSSYYKINLSAIQRWERNQINCRPDRECAELIEANPEATVVAEVFFPQNTVQDFTSDTNPAFRYHSGRPSPLALKEIYLEDDGSISFSVIEPVKNTGTTIFQDAVVLQWTLDRSIAEYTDSCFVILTSQTGSQVRKTAILDGSKAYVQIEGLTPLTTYDAEFRACTIDGSYSVSRSFRTRNIDPRNSIPFIYLAGIGRAPDGSFYPGTTFPLKVYNSVGAVSIFWTFNGSFLHSDRMFTVNMPGTLCAEVEYPDGSIDIITKEIVLYSDK